MDLARPTLYFKWHGTDPDQGRDPAGHPYQQNCSLVWCTRTKRGAVIDPGGELERIKAALAHEGVTLEKVLLTHGHLDHASGAARLAREFGVPVEGAASRRPVPAGRAGAQRHAAGVRRGGELHPDALARGWRHGDGGRGGARRAALPGAHARPCRVLPPGREGGVSSATCCSRARSGGRIFRAGIISSSWTSITGRLWPLGDDMHFVPGHGPISTFGQERKTNPYVADEALGIVREMRDGPRRPY